MIQRKLLGEASRDRPQCPKLLVPRKPLPDLPSPDDDPEQRLIALLSVGSPATPAGPGDDAAVLPDGTVVTVDALVEGVHWDARLAPADVGWKAVAVSVSDCAAMGARPAWMVLALSVPGPDDAAWVGAFAIGLHAAATAFGVPLVGGDTTRSPGPRFVSITMGGRAARPILRSGARPGDDLWMTGWPGLAGAGYALADPPPAALIALRRPQPRVALGVALSEQALATAMMDLSDGLRADLPRLAARSGVGADVNPAALPIHPALRAVPDVLRLQVAAGDDYELLFTARPDDRSRVLALAAELGVPCARIGAITAGLAVRLIGADWPTPIFAHFSGAK